MLTDMRWQTTARDDGLASFADSTLVVGFQCPMGWALTRCLGGRGAVPPEWPGDSELAEVESLVMVLADVDIGQSSAALLGQARRFGFFGYVLVLDLTRGWCDARLPTEDTLVGFVSLPASLADIHAKLAAGRGRRLSSTAAASVRSGYDNNELRTFLRNNLGHGSFASVRRTFTQAQHALRAGDRASADRHLENCRQSCRRAIDCLVSEAKRCSVRTDTRRVLEEMKTALEETSVLLEQLRSGIDPEAAASRTEVLIDSVQATIDTVAPKKGDV